MQTATREPYLDWLRIIAILGVLFFHSAMPFVSEWKWHIKNEQTSNLLMECNFFLSRFRMPLLFFISGAVTYFMLRKRSTVQFIGLRFKRLFLPLVFGMLLLVPIQVYLERLTQGFKGNFLDFYPTVFTSGPYPQGNLSWHHLWFIAYLFVYDVLFAPAFTWCIKNRHRLFFLHQFGRGARIYLLMLPSVIYFTGTVLIFPETHALIDDWCWNVYWLLFLVCGFCCMCIPSLLYSLERNRRTSLTFALIAILIINYFRWNDLDPATDAPDNMPATYAYLSLYPVVAWFWVFAAVGYGKRYLTKSVGSMPYINGALYPFYILHQTVIVLLAYYVVKTTDSIFLKYGFIVVVTFILTLLIYHLFIKPFTLMKLLFGVKQQREQLFKKKEIIGRSPEIAGTFESFK